MKTIFTLITLLFFAGCASRPAPLPKEAYRQLPFGAMNLDIKDDSQFGLKKSLGNSLLQKIATFKRTKKDVEYNILTLSGGGSAGAFGVGVLQGWQTRGDMPQFDVVTGISTGSIISTFIFLGGNEVTHIADIYKNLTNDKLYHLRPLSFFMKNALVDPTPLKTMIQKEITPQLLQKVANEYKKGRRLYVGTTNLDTGGLVVWDMGAIAASNYPNKLQRYRDIIYASSAIPFFFPAQYFQVNYHNKTYYQMHVDGGIYAYTFMVGLLIDWQKVLNLQTDIRGHFHTHMYTIANRKYHLKSAKKPVESNTLSMVKAMLKTQTDLAFDCSMRTLYFLAKKRNIDYKFIFIPQNLQMQHLPSDFDPKEMNRVFTLGYTMGREQNWQTKLKEDIFTKPLR